MSLSPETVLELMALSDGELAGEAKERAEALVNTDAQARQVFETMRAGHIGAWLKENLESTAVAAGADLISDTVVSRLSASSTQRAARGIRRSNGSAEPGRQWGRGARLAFGAAGAGLALAAGVLLYVGKGRLVIGDRPQVANVRGAPIDSALSGVATPAAVGQGASSEGVVVDEIDSPSHGISLFEIASAGGSPGDPRHAASVVIWIEDEQGAK
jgi:hypothetical protein